MGTNRSLNTLIVFLVAVMPLCVSAQVNRRFPLSPSETIPPPPVETSRGPDIGRRVSLRASGLGSSNGQNLGNRQRHFDGTGELRHDRINTADPALDTIPFWSDSFDYQGLTFKYSMAGTDPKKGSKSTVIPTELIPLRFVFADGNVFDASTDLIDGQTAIQGIINSPIFQNYNFGTGGTSIGFTQYGDAFQRANFWDSVSTRSPNYHVLLGQPAVLPVQTINVPAGMGSYYFDAPSGITVPLVNPDFLAAQTNALYAALNISPRSLPIVVWGRVISESRSAGPGNPGAGGWHGVIKYASGAAQTYIGSGYHPLAVFRGAESDVYILSHEVVEWMDDPFTDNFTPGWNIPFIEPVERCDSGSVAYGLLETGDPVEFFDESSVALPGTSFTYHVTEAMFIDFYTRSSRSRSVNGQYSLFEIGAPFGLPTQPSSECVGGVQADPRTIDVPGATFTTARGVNNRDEVVGYYVDQQSHYRGFSWKNGSFSAVDYPGAIGTIASNINDRGDIAGFFFDSTGLPHGFTYINRRWTRIDYPGSTDTLVEGINSSGDIVGMYDSTQPVTHGFILRNGRFTRIDTPFALQSEISGINDLGGYVGDTWNDPFNGPAFGLIGGKSGQSMLNMPYAQFTYLSTLNNKGMIGGNFDNGDGYSAGLVQLFGHLHEVDKGLGHYIYVYGNNDQSQIVGQVYDFDLGRWTGFIGELPLARNAH